MLVKSCSWDSQFLKTVFCPCCCLIWIKFGGYQPDLVRIWRKSTDFSLTPSRTFLSPPGALDCDRKNQENRQRNYLNQKSSRLLAFVSSFSWDFVFLYVFYLETCFFLLNNSRKLPKKRPKTSQNLPKTSQNLPNRETETKAFPLE